MTPDNPWAFLLAEWRRDRKSFLAELALAGLLMASAFVIALLWPV